MLLKRHKRKGPIGLDIGSSGIRMLQLACEAGQPVVVASAFCELPNNLPDTADMLEIVSKTISDALRRHPFEGRDVVTAFGNGEFQLKNIRLPRMPAEEMPGAIEFEAKERFDLSRAPAQIRHLSVGEVRHGNELKEEVIVFAALEEAVQARIALLESLKLTPIAIDLTPVRSHAHSFAFCAAPKTATRSTCLSTWVIAAPTSLLLAARKFPLSSKSTWAAFN
ncbi:MAG: pilus assembly protein PilM [Planctomycetes bacterium]|nr:pilus assembly protein PilM [Planctomycetota bacterium]